MKKSELNNMLRNTNMNWYQKHSSINNQITQEAGWKDEIVTPLLASLVLILGGFTIKEASERMNMSEEEITSAISNPYLLEQAKQISRAEQSQQNSETPKESQSENSALIENILTRTIFAETQGDSLDGKMAVASVIFKRGNGNPEQMVQAIQVPNQFSCWNKADENDWTNMKQRSGRDWEESKNIAKSLINGTFIPTGNWDHYWNPDKADPSWAYQDEAKSKIRPYEQVGAHRFLTLKRWRKS